MIQVFSFLLVTNLAPDFLKEIPKGDSKGTDCHSCEKSGQWKRTALSGALLLQKESNHSKK